MGLTNETFRETFSTTNVKTFMTRFLILQETVSNQQMNQVGWTRAKEKVKGVTWTDESTPQEIVELVNQKLGNVDLFVSVMICRDILPPQYREQTLVELLLKDINESP